MDYKDPIATAKAILEGEYQKSLEEELTNEEEVIEEDTFDFDDESSDSDLEEAKHSKKNEEEDDDEEDEDEEEMDEAYGKMNAAKKGKVPPQFMKNVKKKGDDDDDEELDEAETILDVEDNQSADGKKATKPEKGKKKQPEPKMKPSDASGKIDTPKMQEHMDALFGGEELSEDFKDRASTIFEAAVADRVNEIETELREDHDKVITEHVETLRAELTERLDDYLGYVVEEWMKENELAVEKGIRGDIAENFIHGLKGLFESCYVDVPNEKYDLIDGMATKIEELEEQVNEGLNNNISLRKEILEHRCTEVFVEVAEGLVDTQVEKLRSLSEGLEFETEEQYRDKLNVLKESYFGDKDASESSTDYVETGIVNEGTEASQTDNSVMSHYANAISRQAKGK